MDFRTKRQLTVLAIIAAFFVLVGGTIVYRALPEPTCFDQRRNQGEAGIDCGGPCIPCALAEAKPIEVFWVKFVETRESSYDVAAELKNPNGKLAAASFDYEFRLNDTAGVLVAARSGRSFLYPGELAHISEIGLSSGREIKRASLAIDQVIWRVAEGGAPDVIAGGKEHVIRAEDGAPISVVKASVTNRTLSDRKDVRATVLLSDRDGNLIGVSSTVLPELPAGLARPVEFRWPISFGDRVGSITIEPRVPPR